MVRFQPLKTLICHRVQIKPEAVDQLQLPGKLIHGSVKKLEVWYSIDSMPLMG